MDILQVLPFFLSRNSQLDASITQYQNPIVQCNVKTEKNLRSWCYLFLKLFLARPHIRQGKWFYLAPSRENVGIGRWKQFLVILCQLGSKAEVYFKRWSAANKCAGFCLNKKKVRYTIVWSWRVENKSCLIQGLLNAIRLSICTDTKFFFFLI